MCCLEVTCRLRTIFAVEEGGEHDEQAGERGLAGQAPVRVRRAQRHRALAGVAQPLRQPHHEQVHRRLAVVQRQRAQHRRQPDDDYKYYIKI